MSDTIDMNDDGAETLAVCIVNDLQQAGFTCTNNEDAEVSVSTKKGTYLIFWDLVMYDPATDDIEVAIMMMAPNGTVVVDSMDYTEAIQSMIEVLRSAE